MDRRSDCVSAGYLDVRRDQTVFVLARSNTPETSPELSCTLYFRPQTKGDTLKLSSLGLARVLDCGVKFTIRMTDNNVSTHRVRP